MKSSIETKLAPAAIGPYSQAITSGKTIFASGQIPLDPRTGELVGDTIGAQTHQVMKNIDAVLQAGGATFGDILKTTIFLTDLADFQVVNEIYASYLVAPFPARSTVQVAALPKGAKVEIETIAQIS